MSQVSVITGSRSGLGLAVHRRLVEFGHICISIARAPIGTEGGRHVIADLAKRYDWKAELHPTLNQIDVEELWFFDIAAILPYGPLATHGFEARMDEAMKVNVMNPLAIAGALVSWSIDHGGVPVNVIHVSSGAATRAIREWGAYCASKAAAAISWEAFEMEHTFVRTHIFQPGIMATSMQQQLRDRRDPGAAPESLLRTPEEVAEDMLEQYGFIA